MLPGEIERERQTEAQRDGEMESQWRAGDNPRDERSRPTAPSIQRREGGQQCFVIGGAGSVDNSEWGVKGCGGSF